jgi:hypothetical protein
VEKEIRRFFTMEDASDDEKKWYAVDETSWVYYMPRGLAFIVTAHLPQCSWIDAFLYFLRKLSVAAGDRRLVLKSPSHTAKVVRRGNECRAVRVACPSQL